MPECLQTCFKKNKKAEAFFNSLAFTDKREYVEWVLGAKKQETLQKRLAVAIEKLLAGKKNYNEK